MRAAERYTAARRHYLELHEANVLAEQTWQAAAAAANEAHREMKTAEAELLRVAAQEG